MKKTFFFTVKVWLTHLLGKMIVPFYSIINRREERKQKWEKEGYQTYL